MQCEISRQFFDMLGEISAGQKIPREFDGGLVLYRSELNLLQLIDDYPEFNVSELSAKSGVTKSAVTQMSIKLLEKGLIEKYKSPHNKKEKYFRLTPLGKTVRAQGDEETKAASEQMRKYLCSLSIEEKKTIIEFIKNAKNFMPSYSFNCSNDGKYTAPCIKQK